MAGKDYYTLTEAAQVLEVTQRRLLEMLETGEIEGERDSQSSRWKVSKHSVHELVPETDTDGSSPEEHSEQPAVTVRQLVDELGNLQRELGHLRKRLELAQRAEYAAWQEEKEHLLVELKEERERCRQEREEAESALRAEQERWREEKNRLREELESERDKGSWRRLLGG